MTETPHAAGAPATPDEIAAEIASTRAALGETVAALAAKADVKARITETVAETSDSIAAGISQTADQMAGIFAALANHVRRHPVPWLLAAAAVLIALGTRSSRR